MTHGKDIVKTADLARMELTTEEQERLAKEFAQITAYFEELQKLELEGEMVLPYPCPRIADKLRDYEINVKELTEHLKDGQFLVPPWLA